MSSFFSGLFSPVTNLLNSFKLNAEGWSGRKISAAACFTAAIYIAITQVPTEDKIYAMNSLLIGGGVCLGLITIPQVIELMRGTKGTVIETSKTETRNETTLQ